MNLTLSHPEFPLLFSHSSLDLSHSLSRWQKASSIADEDAHTRTSDQAPCALSLSPSLLRDSDSRDAEQRLLFLSPSVGDATRVLPPKSALETQCCCSGAQIALACEVVEGSGSQSKVHRPLPPDSCVVTHASGCECECVSREAGVSQRRGTLDGTPDYSHPDSGK